MNAPTPEATTTTRTEQADYQVRLDWVSRDSPGWHPPIW